MDGYTPYKYIERRKRYMLAHQVSTASQTAESIFGDAADDLFRSRDDAIQTCSIWGESIVVSVFNVCILLSTAVTLTLCINGVTSIGSDEYTVLIFCTAFAVILSLILAMIFKLLALPGCKIEFTLQNWRIIVAIALFNFMGFSAFAYASDVTKTPPQLQIILFGLEVPLTVFFRYLFLKQGNSHSK